MAGLASVTFFTEMPWSQLIDVACAAVRKNLSGGYTVRARVCVCMHTYVAEVLLANACHS